MELCYFLVVGTPKKRSFLLVLSSCWVGFFLPLSEPLNLFQRTSMASCRIVSRSSLFLLQSCSPRRTQRIFSSVFLPSLHLPSFSLFFTNRCTVFSLSLSWSPIFTFLFISLFFTLFLFLLLHSLKKQP